MSAVNLSEVEAKLSDRGLGKGGLEDLPAFMDPQTLAFVQAQAALAAGLRCLTRRVGLSLGDQACLALTIPRGFRRSRRIAAVHAWHLLLPPNSLGQMAPILTRPGPWIRGRWPVAS